MRPLQIDLARELPELVEALKTMEDRTEIRSRQQFIRGVIVAMSGALAVWLTIVCALVYSYSYTAVLLVVALFLGALTMVKSHRDRGMPFAAFLLVVVGVFPFALFLLIQHGRQQYEADAELLKRDVESDPRVPFLTHLRDLITSHNEMMSKTDDMDVGFFIGMMNLECVLYGHQLAQALLAVQRSWKEVRAGTYSLLYLRPLGRPGDTKEVPPTLLESVKRFQRATQEVVVAREALLERLRQRYPTGLGP